MVGWFTSTYLGWEEYEVGDQEIFLLALVNGSNHLASLYFGKMRIISSVKTILTCGFFFCLFFGFTTSQWVDADGKSSESD